MRDDPPQRTPPYSLLGRHSWFQRFYTVDALKADNYKQLKAEYAFAANKTVDDFIAHFKHASFAGTVPEGGATPSVLLFHVAYEISDRQNMVLI